MQVCGGGRVVTGGQGGVGTRRVQVCGGGRVVTGGQGGVGTRWAQGIQMTSVGCVDSIIVQSADRQSNAIHI